MNQWKQDGGPEGFLFDDSQRLYASNDEFSSASRLLLFLSCSREEFDEILESFYPVEKLFFWSEKILHLLSAESRNWMS